MTPPIVLLDAPPFDLDAARRVAEGLGPGDVGADLVSLDHVVVRTVNGIDADPANQDAVPSIGRDDVGGPD